jgi:hypothetical protein
MKPSAPAMQQEAPPSYEDFTVRTNVKKALVKFSTKETCYTPCTVTKRSDEEFVVTVSKQGYKTATRTVRSVAAADSNAKVLAGTQTQPAERKVQLIPNPLVVNLDPAWAKD